MGRKLNYALRQILSSESRLDIRNIKYLPRWAILGIDISIIVVADLLTGIALRDLTSNFYDFLSVYERMFLVVGVNIFFFFVFRTYSGLIRHSSYVDALRIMLACFSTFVTLIFVNYLTYFLVGEKIYLVAGLIFYFLVSFSLLFLFRLSVKQLYEYFKATQKNQNLEKAVVFGADENAISIAGALEIEHPKRFDIRGFITNDNTRRNIRILGKPVIYNGLKVSAEAKALGASALILSENTLTAEEKFSLVEECLENNIKVFNAPIVSNYEDEQSVSNKVKSLQIEDLLDREPILLNKENKRQQLTGKTILVTGGAGSIGSEIVRQVAEYKPKLLIILDQAETPMHNLQLEIQGKFPDLNFNCIICDVGNRKRLELLFQKRQVDVIYHAAAYKHVPLMEANPHEAVFVNIQGTKNLSDLALEYKVGHFVMVSTDKAVNPTNVMGASKRAAEMYVQALYHSACSNMEGGTKFITTRFGNVLGSNGSVVPLFRKQIEKGGPVTITHPDIIRYFMTIPEACQLVLEAGAMGKGGEIFIFDMGEPVKIMDLAIKMIKLAGFIPNKQIGIKITGLRPGEKLYEELLSDKSKTLPTHHKKIMIAVDTPGNYEEINVSIEKIIKSASKLKSHKVVGKLKMLVPEFKSKNSTFEKLDKLSSIPNPEKKTI
ncbi:polysaccharide biosynthesis protein [Salinimicrobium sediminilitoris]|uniref:polysaccharide biosynthesis protein n=1 Tax=Salinimicrobium sediminilitoris TaxID=2876715 RepID=UPI001E54D715|nr:nucleoside-diphosphate sugar epimerase/dehydratase [Salinimicrobium sediminilitoris]MCC8358729.1 polysaccharide biosynthesis protein [Salinimicrobium sediminilitoris]